MKKELIVDRVIGTKHCLKCGHPVVLEGYTIPEVTKRLEQNSNCYGVVEIKNAFTIEVEAIRCNSMEFTKSKFEVKMKPQREWINPLMKRMGK